ITLAITSSPPPSWTELTCLRLTSYDLQHPDSMNYTAGTFAGLRTGLAALLDGRATPEEMRRCTRPAVDGPVRIARRAGDAVVLWRRGRWLRTVADVLTGEGDAIASTARVLPWARAVRDTLDPDRS